jgi:hypothetical protein
VRRVEAGSVSRALPRWRDACLEALDRVRRIVVRTIEVMEPPEPEAAGGVPGAATAIGLHLGHRASEVGRAGVAGE